MKPSYRLDLKPHKPNPMIPGKDTLEAEKLGLIKWNSPKTKISVGWDPWIAPVEADPLALAVGASAPTPRPFKVASYSPGAAVDARYQRFQDNEKFIELETLEPQVVAGDAFELARFRCRSDELGVIEGLWQWLQIFPIVPQPARHLSLMPAPQNSLQRNPYFAQAYNVQVRWYIRLTQTGSTPLSDTYWTGNIAPDGTGLPGFAWSDCYNYQFPEIKWAWGFGGDSFRMKVPPGFVVRVFVHLINYNLEAIRPVTIGARIWGWRQGLNTPEAEYNQRLNIW